METCITLAGMPSDTRRNSRAVIPAKAGIQRGMGEGFSHLSKAPTRFIHHLDVTDQFSTSCRVWPPTQTLKSML